MAKDYGSRRSAKQRGSMANQLLMATFTFVLGYLTATVWDIEKVTNWLNTEVLAHKEARSQSTKVEPQHAQTQPKPKPKFEFYTLLTNEKGQGAGKNNAHAEAHGTKTTTTATTVGAAKPSEANASAHTAQAVAKVTEGKPLTPIPAANALPAKGSFLVQVAAFKAQHDAEHMKGLLILKGYDVHVVAVRQPKGNWFRVVVGPYPDKIHAQKAQINIAKSERLKGVITRVDS